MSLNFDDLSPIEQNVVLYLLRSNCITKNLAALTFAAQYKSKAKQYYHKYVSMDRSLIKIYSRDALLGLRTLSTPDATDLSYINLILYYKNYLSLFEAVNFAINLHKSKQYNYKFTDPSLGTSITMSRSYLIDLFNLSRDRSLCSRPIN